MYNGLKMTKKEAQKLYFNFLMNNMGYQFQEDASNHAKEVVISGKQHNDTFLIKIKDTVGYSNYCYELISPKKYVTLVKQGSKFYRWKDDSSIKESIEYPVPEEFR